MATESHETLPAVDEPPDEWGPDHDDIELSQAELRIGNALGDVIDPDDDDDNGMADDVIKPPR